MLCFPFFLLFCDILVFIALHLWVVEPTPMTGDIKEKLVQQCKIHFFTGFRHIYLNGMDSTLFNFLKFEVINQIGHSNLNQNLHLFTRFHHHNVRTKTI